MIYPAKVDEVHLGKVTKWLLQAIGCVPRDVAYLCFVHHREVEIDFGVIECYIRLLNYVHDMGFHLLSTLIHFARCILMVEHHDPDLSSSGYDKHDGKVGLIAK